MNAFSAARVNESLDRAMAAYHQHRRTSFADRASRMRKAASLLDAESREVFFHRTELTTVDFDSLQEGESVTFDIVDSPKGPRARNLQKVG